MLIVVKIKMILGCSKPDDENESNATVTSEDINLSIDADKAFLKIFRYPKDVNLTN